MRKRMIGRAVRNRKKCRLKKIRRSGNNHKKKHRKLKDNWRRAMMIMMKILMLMILIRTKVWIINWASKKNNKNLKSFYARFVIKYLSLKSS